MKYEGFYNKAGRFTKKAWRSTKKALNHKRVYNPAWTLFITAIGAFVVFVVFRYSQTAWLFFSAIWHDRSPIQSEQTLQLAIGLLTLLVTIIAIFMGVIIVLARRDWGKFKEEQEPIIKELKKETDELDWISKIRKGVEKNPHLDADDADVKEAIDSIKKHYFERDQYNEAWKLFGVARWYEKEEQYSYAIENYKKSDDVDLDEGHYDSNELRKHIWQSLGKNYFQRGIELEDDDKDAAIEAYMKAINYSKKVIEKNPKFAMAHFNKASALIQLGKIEGAKTEPYNDANYCYKEAIKSLEIIEENYEHFYDKARAYALLDQPDEAVESLRHSFRLAERDLGKLVHYLKRDKKDFENVEGKAEFKALVK